jgi:hypothetical protein
MSKFLSEKIKKLNFSLILVLGIVWLVAYYFVVGVECEVGCATGLVEEILEPLYYSVPYLFGYSLVMFFLPSRYFINWFRWILLPGVIFLSIVYFSIPLETGSYLTWPARIMAMQVIAQALGIISLFFILGTWLYERRRIHGDN